MLVNKKALVLKEVTRDDDFRLSHLRITSKDVTATDGKILLQLDNPSQEMLGEFPTVEGLSSTENTVYLNKTTLSKIEKNLPKNSRIPILENFVIGEEGNKFVVFSTDLENDIKITQRKPEIEYPDVEKFYKKEEEYKFKVRISVKLLKKLVKVVESLSKDNVGIDFSFTDNNEEPIKIEFKEGDVKLKGLICPMRF